MHTTTRCDTNITTQDELEELEVTLCDKQSPSPHLNHTAIMTPKSPISEAILDLIKDNVGLGGCTIALRILTPNPQVAEGN